MSFPHHPISDKQCAANYANAQRSTGPRTSEGKARSALNARKHGFTASTFAVVRLDSPELAGDGDIEITRAQNRNFALGEGFHRLARKSNCWSLFLRYQAQSERLYRRAVEEFERLKRLRHELPNEPISEPEPEENKPAVDLETNPFPALDAASEAPLAPEAATLLPGDVQPAADPPDSPRDDNGPGGDRVVIGDAHRRDGRPPSCGSGGAGIGF